MMTITGEGEPSASWIIFKTAVKEVGKLAFSAQAKMTSSSSRSASYRSLRMMGTRGSS